MPDCVAMQVTACDALQNLAVNDANQVTLMAAEAPPVGPHASLAAPLHLQALRRAAPRRATTL
jgi:hypothetical protein